MYPYQDGALFGMNITILSIVLLVFYVVAAIGSWKMFEKAHEAGWKALIPFYNDYIRFKISWNTRYFWIYLVLECVGGCLIFFAPNLMAAYIAETISIVAGIMWAVLQYNIAAAYGKGLGYTLGLILFPYLFYMIIGFGGAQYVGNRYEMAETL